MKGNFKFKFPISDKLIMGFKAFNMAGGQYKMIFEKELGPVCQGFYQESLKDSHEEFVKATNSTWKWGQCPFPVETIFINDWTPISLFNFSII